MIVLPEVGGEGENKNEEWKVKSEELERRYVIKCH